MRNHLLPLLLRWRCRCLCIHNLRRHLGLLYSMRTFLYFRLLLTTLPLHGNPIFSRVKRDRSWFALLINKLFFWFLSFFWKILAIFNRELLLIGTILNMLLLYVQNIWLIIAILPLKQKHLKLFHRLLLLLFISTTTYFIHAKSHMHFLAKIILSISNISHTTFTISFFIK